MLKGKGVIVPIKNKEGRYLRGEVKNHAEKEAGLMLIRVTKAQGNNDEGEHPDCFIPWHMVNGPIKFISED